MLGRGDDNKEADDLTDLLAALLEGTSSPEVSNILEVLNELSAVAEDVDGLTSNDLEDLASTDVSNDVTDSLLKASKTASLEGVGDGLDGVGKLKKSTLDSLDVELLDASEEVGPAGIHVSDDDVDVTGAARGVTHRGAHALSNTADQLVDIGRGGRLVNLSVVLVQEDAEDLSDVLTSAVEVASLPGGSKILEELDQITAVRPDVHDLVLDESLELALLDLSDDLDDGVSSLLEAASLETVSKLLNTVSKGEEALHDRLNTEGLDAVSDQLDGVVEVASHVGDVPHTGGGIAHDDIKAVGNTLQEGDDIILGGHLTILVKLLSRSDHETRLIDCSGRNDQSKKNKAERTHCCGCPKTITNKKTKNYQ